MPLSLDIETLIYSVYDGSMLRVCFLEDLDRSINEFLFVCDLRCLIFGEIMVFNKTYITLTIYTLYFDVI